MDGGQVALSKDGKRAAYAWMSDEGGKRRVFVAVGDTAIAPEADQLIDGVQQIQPEVIVLADGRPLVAFDEGGRIRIVTINATGKASPPVDACESAGEQHYPDLAQLPDGVVLLAFEQAENGKNRVCVVRVTVADGSGESGK
jgi:hypothetical protein